MESKTFTLTSEQYDAISRWADTHKCSYRRLNSRRGMSFYDGGEISYIFTPHHQYTSVSAKCICGKKITLDLDW